MTTNTHSTPVHAPHCYDPPTFEQGADGVTAASSPLDHRTLARAIAPATARRGHYLAVEDGDRQLLVPLESRITHIGRGFTADVRVYEPHVSVDHAILVRHGRHFRALDNRSANGTFVNGRRVSAVNLSDGDVLRIGGVVMQFVEVP